MVPAKEHIVIVDTMIRQMVANRTDRKIFSGQDIFLSPFFRTANLSANNQHKSVPSSTVEDDRFFVLSGTPSVKLPFCQTFIPSDLT
jgi:hypothetical protein